MSVRRSWLMVVLALVPLLGAACTSKAAPPAPRPATPALRVGDPAPGFSLPSAQGGSVSLAGFHGRKPVLLYFSMGPG